MTVPSVTGQESKSSGIALLLNAASLGGQHRMGTVGACISSATLWKNTGQKKREGCRKLSQVDSWQWISERCTEGPMPVSMQGESSEAHLWPASYPSWMWGDTFLVPPAGIYSSCFRAPGGRAVSAWQRQKETWRIYSSSREAMMKKAPSCDGRDTSLP